MYEYTWYQWLSFFYIYCFLGWCFESTYVSLREKRFVNRGFLRLPLLPLYGTGAVVILWVSLPVKDSLLLVYLTGMAAATLLEYATGWGMERLFRVRYWDYSNQRFNVNGYICLSSSIAWGFLTLLLTEVIHRPIERYVLGLPLGVELAVVCVVSVLFAADAAQSVRTALDLAKSLEAMTKLKAEADELRVQLSLLRENAEQRVADTAEDAAQKLAKAKADASLRLADARKDAALRLELARSRAAEQTAQLREDTARRAESLELKAAARADRIRQEAAARTGKLRDGAAKRAESVFLKATEKTELAKLAAAGKAALVKESAAQQAARTAQKADELSRRLAELLEKRRSLACRMGFYRRSLLNGNPSASSKFGEALEELCRQAKQRHKKDA